METWQLLLGMLVMMFVGYLGICALLHRIMRILSNYIREMERFREENKSNWDIYMPEIVTEMRKELLKEKRMTADDGK